MYYYTISIHKYTIHIQTTSNNIQKHSNTIKPPCLGGFVQIFGLLLKKDENFYVF